MNKVKLINLIIKVAFIISQKCTSLTDTEKVFVFLYNYLLKRRTYNCKGNIRTDIDAIMYTILYI